MCGILGWQFPLGLGQGAEVLAGMSALIAHRGPDDSGHFFDEANGIALGHRRLSIIDLSAASHQPMNDTISGVTLIYNGELYNFRELRTDLEALGHTFRSAGDTEVVLRGYLEWGSASFARFAGMFALAIWDQRTQVLHLARDATGMKPLYYLPCGDGIAFASELKAFQALPGFTAAIDPVAVQQYLEFGYVFEEDQTMLQGVRKVAPGHRLEISNGQIRINAAWFTPPSPDARDTRQEQDRVEELGELLQKVVGEHLIADVPLAVMLSGGLDSSVVASLASKQSPLLTITMGFSGAGFDERDNARRVSQFIGSRHVEVLITPEEVKREVVQGVRVFDDLFADWGTVTTRILYRRCRQQGIKVVLVGEGADELFGGYGISNVPHRLGLWQKFRLYQKYAGRRYGTQFGRFRSVLDEYLEASQGDGFDAVRLFETRRQLPNQYVMKVDKASMAESVEARAPYLDRRVAELAYRTPRQWLLRGGENKYLLRAMSRQRQLLPDAVSAQPKFGAPLAADWMDDDTSFRRFAAEQLLDSSSQTQRLGLGNAMKAYFEDNRAGYAFPAGISIFRNLAWRLLLLELWAQHYLAPHRP
ncbi:asparagine synthase (glutamine-hydrolyzing) [Caenimonas koreensis]|uniref:asparagine synthase (glutamine-hydrolyzing) n=1 Tax=Caenimonas koreensis TaxID=367474 RepID=UPI003784F21A